MENLKSFLDQELDLAQRAEVETHLNNDPALLEVANDFKAISAALKTADSGAPYGYEALLAKLGKRPASQNSAPQNSVSETPPKMRFLDRFRKPLSLGLAASGLVMSFVMLKSLGPRVASDDMATNQIQVASAPRVDSAIGKFQSAASEMELMRPSRAKGSETAKAIPGNETMALDQTARAGMPAPPAGGVRSELNLPFEIPKGLYLERSAQMVIKTDDLGSAEDRVAGIMGRYQGFVMSSNMEKTPDGGNSYLSLKVPSKMFDGVVMEIQKLGDPIRVTKSSQDITSETVDAVSRTQTWADEEARLIRELAKAKDRDKWAIRGQLSTVRANLSAYREVAKSLRERANYSTIDLTLTTDESVSFGPRKNWSRESYKNATGILSDIGRILGSAIIYTLVLAPAWVPLLAAFLIWRKRPRP